MAYVIVYVTKKGEEVQQPKLGRFTSKREAQKVAREQNVSCKLFGYAFGKYAVAEE